jgi:hypothetical protein
MPASKEIFAKYPNQIFIETGSWHGDGIQQALDAGFSEIYSIELSRDLYNLCVERFKDNPKVHLMQGDSAYVLNNLIPIINQPATFWLDGHYSGGDTALGSLNSPLIQELEAIKRSHIKNHTILIDDLRCWVLGQHGFNTEIIKQKCLEINSKYLFTFEDGFIENDILVAKC